VLAAGKWRAEPATNALPLTVSLTLKKQWFDLWRNGHTSQLVWIERASILETVNRFAD